MLQDDLQQLHDLVQGANPAAWLVAPTPAHLDLAAHAPEDRPTATLWSGKTPVATFWSYMHNGPLNADLVCWMGNNLSRMLSGTLSCQEASTGIAKLTALPYRDWWQGPTPFYLHGGDPYALTMRSNQHTEEIATVWGPNAQLNACLIAWLVTGAADILAWCLGPDGDHMVVREAGSALADRWSDELRPRDVNEALGFVSTHPEDRIPLSTALNNLDATFQERFFGNADRWNASKTETPEKNSGSIIVASGIRY